MAAPQTRIEVSSINLSGLPRKEARISEKDGTTSVFEGYSLGDVLARMGVSIGVHPKGRPPVESVVVEGGDGYRALFSKSELDPAFTDAVTLLADRQNGKPLLPSEGPMRLIAPQDRIRSRWVKQVRAIEVSGSN
jgi:DMSO/TMAO reductase YedYZ molybdopterin-dependent catalytic subunit